MKPSTARVVIASLTTAVLDLPQREMLPAGDYTSTLRVVATPNEVANAGNAYTCGLYDAMGYYDFGINSNTNTICYHIRFTNFKSRYQGPALTATHIHQAAVGRSGPRRIAFPNRVRNNVERISHGCLQEPFLTSILANGIDTGTGFEVRQIEQNPSAFFADVHSVCSVAGAVRGQLG